MKDYVESNELLYTPSICLTGIKSRYLKEGERSKTRIELIVERSFIVPLNVEAALLVAEMKQRYKLHAVDAIVYATSQHKNLTLVTEDQHFNVEII